MSSKIEIPKNAWHDISLIEDRLLDSGKALTVKNIVTLAKHTYLNRGYCENAYDFLVRDDASEKTRYHKLLVAKLLKGAPIVLAEQSDKIPNLVIKEINDVKIRFNANKKPVIAYSIENYIRENPKQYAKAWKYFFDCQLEDSLYRNELLEDLTGEKERIESEEDNLQYDSSLLI